MFTQIIQARAGDPQRLRTRLDRWVDELAPGARGWLGTTAGVTPDGQFFAAVRFSSPEDAHANSDRPEQGKWWGEFAEHLEGEVTFRDCPDTDVWLDGGSDDAGFVQAIQGRITDQERFRAAQDRFQRLDRELLGRPEIIGGLVGVTDSTLTQVVYFTSEAEARAGERKDAPAEVAEILDEWMASMTDVTYLDLSEPWMYSPA